MTVGTLYLKFLYFKTTDRKKRNKHKLKNLSLLLRKTPFIGVKVGVF